MLDIAYDRQIPPVVWPIVPDGFAVGTEELLAHPEMSLDDASRWAFVGGLMLFITSQSIMARRFTGSLTWERFAFVGFLDIAGLAFGGLSGAALVAAVCLAMLATLGVETVRHREALAQLRAASN